MDYPHHLKPPAVAISVYNWPDFSMVTVLEVLPDWDPTRSTAWTTSRPSTTWPKTTCLPSSQEVLTVQMKNCEPLLECVSGAYHAQGKSLTFRGRRWPWRGYRGQCALG